MFLSGIAHVRVISWEKDVFLENVWQFQCICSCFPNVKISFHWVIVQTKTVLCAFSALPQQFKWHMITLRDI